MPTLPDGTITFLFTDIEGSAQLWETHPDAMQLALARHDALLRQTIESHGGIVFKTIGDAFCAAFPTASDALQAALAAQLALHAESWPAPIVLKVRMALHTGAAEARDNDYFGPPLNRVARILAAGHGGQLLVSTATESLIRDLLPASISLHSLGAHRLRDLSRAETIFELRHPALPSEFPSLRSLDNIRLPNNLPQLLTSFVGREKEVEEIKALGKSTRLLTLTGAGGCGKTRLSMKIAADTLESYPDGVWLVELVPLSDPAIVPQEVASVLKISEQSEQSIQQTLLNALQFKKLLLILDNCEPLLTACCQFTAALLRSCRNVKALATSREPLGIVGEFTYRVPSLAYPNDRQTLTPESLGQYEAAQLFIERARQHKRDFVVTDRNASALAQLCYHLDGIPLAIELAAARIRSLSVEDINSKLDNRFRLLTGGDRSALPRQQTLRALIDWSCDLLNAPEKSLMGRLATFAGGWTLEAAEQVCSSASGEQGSIEAWEVLELLLSLVDKSLVLADEQDGVMRY